MYPSGGPGHTLWLYGWPPEEWQHRSNGSLLCYLHRGSHLPRLYSYAIRFWWLPDQKGKKSCLCLRLFVTCVLIHFHNSCLFCDIWIIIMRIVFICMPQVQNMSRKESENTPLPVWFGEMATQSCLPIAVCCSLQLCVKLWSGGVTSECGHWLVTPGRQAWGVESRRRVSKERACAAAVMSMILLAPAPLPVCCDQGPDSAISSPC